MMSKCNLTCTKILKVDLRFSRLFFHFVLTTFVKITTLPKGKITSLRGQKKIIIIIQTRVKKKYDYIVLNKGINNRQSIEYFGLTMTDPLHKSP